jgi:protein-tyrosine phosphatase
MQTVLFLCSGNYYRSRFAEIYFNWQAGQRDLEWRADSRGLQLHPANVGPMSLHTVLRLRTLGIPIDACQRLPRPVADEDFHRAAHVIAVKETEHRPMIERMFPSWLERVEFWEVHDLDCAEADVAIPHLEREVMQLIDRLDRNAIHNPRS